MRVIQSTEELREALSDQESIGFVPTMGALHQGHLDLVRRAAEENRVVVASIFVNPTQFNQTEDFDNYPRQVDRDLELLRNVGCDFVFVPEVREVFPEPDRQQYDLSPVGDVLEGEERPGHFQGVASVVKRLFEIVGPHRAYFGLKDYQQYLLIKHLSESLDWGVEVIGLPTVREPDGLARSSRNQRLDKEGLRIASKLYASLQYIRDRSAGHSSEQLEKMGRAYLGAFPSIRLEYLKVVDPLTLRKPSPDDGSQPRRALLAAWISGVRLIDNIEI